MENLTDRQESDRLDALTQYQILDTPAEPEFDDLVRLLVDICATPYGGITFLDRHRQWFKAAHGHQMVENPREISFCDYAIRRKDALIIDDLRTDARFSANPLVAAGPRIRFYAGVPLWTPDGHALGALCILDQVPRELTPNQVHLLKILGQQVSAQLELRKSRLQLERANQELSIAFSGMIRSHAKALNHQTLLVKSEKMATLGEMASSIVHEINTPLAILQFTSEVIRDIAEAEEIDRKELLNSCVSIEKTIDGIGRIVRSIRSFAREAERDPPEVVAVRDVVENLARLCAKSLDSREILLRVPPIPQDLSLECRESEISQVLLNLINNASDAVHASEATELGEKYIALEIVSREEIIEIAVVDNGPGVPDEIRNRIFQAFFSTKEKDEGTGLGLSISRKIIENHHGRLWLDPHSPPTRFVIALPLRQPAERPRPTSGPR